MVVKRFFLFSMAIVLSSICASTLKADEGMATIQWVSTDLIDDIDLSRVFSDDGTRSFTIKDRPVASGYAEAVPLKAYVDYNGKTLEAIKSANGVSLPGNETNPDDWLLLPLIVKRDKQLPVVARLMLDAEIEISIRELARATDPFDKDGTDIRWSQIDGDWIADIALAPDARMLARFHDGKFVQMAVVRARDVIRSKPRAKEFQASGDYQRCVQQGLLDAGFNPNGVDGKIGQGTNRALRAWLEKRGLPHYDVSNENAGRFCGAFLNKAEPGIKQLYLQGIFFPLTDIGLPGVLEAVQNDPEFVPTAEVITPGTVMQMEYTANKAAQVSLMTITEHPNMPLEGMYFLSGQMKLDDDWKYLEQLTIRGYSLAMYNFGRHVLRETSKQEGAEFNVTYDMFRFAMDGLPNADGHSDDVLWSDLGALEDGRKLIAADIAFQGMNNLRSVVLFADGKPWAASLMPGPSP